MPNFTSAPMPEKADEKVQKSQGAHLIRLALAIIVSLGFVAGTYLADAKIETGIDSEKISLFESDSPNGISSLEDNVYKLISPEDKPLTAIFSANVAIRLAPASIVSFKSNIFDIEKGRVWINAKNSNKWLQIKSGDVTVEVLSSIVDIQKAEKSILIAQQQRTSRVSFAKRTVALSPGEQIIIPFLKLTSLEKQLAEVRYAKLVKEFPLTSFPKDAWTLYNAEQDGILHAKIKDLFIQKSRAKMANIPSLKNGNITESKLNQFLRFITLSEKKRNARALAYVQDVFDAGLTSILRGESNSPSFFEFFSSAATAELDASGINELNNELEQISFADPADSFFKAKAALVNVLANDPIRKFIVALNNIYDVLENVEDATARERAIAFMENFAELKNVSNIQRPARDELFQLWVLYDKIIAKYPQLLREEFIHTGEKLEDAYLALERSKDESVDQRQFYILQKLELIRVIQEWLAKDAVQFQEGRRSVLALARRIEILRPVLTDSAFLTDFDEELTQISPFLSFLRSPIAQQARGSFDGNFELFKSELSEISAVRSLLQSAEGGIAISASRREALAGIVASDAQIAGLIGVKITLPDDETSSLVRIVSAEYERKPFLAMYDTERKIFSEVNFDGKALPYAVRLNNLSQFLMVSMGALKLDDGESIEQFAEISPQQSTLEKIARAKVSTQLKDVGVSVKEEDFDFSDFQQGIIHIRLALIGGSLNERVFSFDVKGNLSTAFALKVVTVNGEIPVNEEFSISELPKKVEQIYQRAVFEKERLLEQELAEEASEETDLPTE